MTNYRLSVNEIFYSIQGEGSSAGRPAVFLRLGGCNLKCVWCDTKYAWKNKHTNNLTLANKKIVQEIKKYPCKHLVITGGEPLLQQDALKVLLKELKEYTAEIETNGSIPCNISELIEQINCSPKLKNSGNLPYPLKIPPSEKVIYKFVVRDKNDLKEIKSFAGKYKIPKSKIWLLPEGTGKSDILKRSKWVVEVCKKEGYNFCPRLHIMIYGNRRGI